VNPFDGLEKLAVFKQEDEKGLILKEYFPMQGDSVAKLCLAKETYFARSLLSMKNV
jgi:hypothetical protein